jgi:hypothetical protein
MLHKEQFVCLCGHFWPLALRASKIENAHDVPRRAVFHFAAAGREHLLVAKLCSSSVSRLIDGHRAPSALALQ